MMFVLCLEVESLIVTMQQGVIRGYEMAEPHAEAMVTIAAKGLIYFHSSKNTYTTIFSFRIITDGLQRSPRKLLKVTGVVFLTNCVSS